MDKKCNCYQCRKSRIPKRKRRRSMKRRFGKTPPSSPKKSSPNISPKHPDKKRIRREPIIQGHHIHPEVFIDINLPPPPPLPANFDN